MSMEETFLTQAGYEKLKKELEYLKTVRRREISREIGEAIAHGDISENAEYDAAKDAQALNENRIAELEDKLSRVRIIDDLRIPADKVCIGSTVFLEDLESGEELTYILVGTDEADLSHDKISTLSPVGHGLLGHKEGDMVEIKVPAGILKYKILKISR